MVALHHVLICMFAIAIASPSAEGATDGTLSIDTTGAIQFCKEIQDCQIIAPTGELKKAIDDGYEQVSIVDLYKNGTQEVAVTSNGTDRCSKFFSFDPAVLVFSAMKFSNKNICNYKINENHLISTYKLDSMQYEDVYDLENGTYQIALSDGCVGCDQVNRIVYQDGKPSERLMVTNQKSYAQRQPITSLVTVDKAWLYSNHSDPSQTKMYLVKGDEVQLLEFSDENGLWYFIKYLSKGKVAFLKWIKCENLAVCK